MFVYFIFIFYHLPFGRLPFWSEYTFKLTHYVYILDANTNAQSQLPKDLHTSLTKGSEIQFEKHLCIKVCPFEYPGTSAKSVRLSNASFA